MTNDPTSFSRPSTNSQFRVKHTKGSVKATGELLGSNNYVKTTKKESNYLNQQRQLLYLQKSTAGIGGGSAAVTSVMRPATCKSAYKKVAKP